MHVLFDKNVPYGVSKFLNDHQIEAVDERGWATISNGELLKSAESAGFEVVLTADQNIVYQQAHARRKIALVVLGSNIWPIVRSHAQEISEQVSAARPGSYAFVEMAPPPKPPKRHSS